MKAFLLAAGNGTRLRPLTDSCPKCLLPIRGKPLLEIWLDNCRQAGIDEVLVNVHSLPEKIREFAAQRNHSLKLRIAEEPQLLGSAGTLAENRSFIGSDEPFFILYGDVLTNVNLRAMLQFHQGKKDVVATLAIHQVDEPRHCGIVGTDEHSMVRSFVEKPENPESNWAFSGIMIATPAVFEAIPAHRPADIGFHLLPGLTGCMAAYRISEYLLDIGTLNNYTRAQSSWPGLG